MSFLDGITESLNNTKKETEIGIGGFNLFARVSESVKYSSVVPTDVLEDGTNSTDDIIKNPISVSVTGEVGDLFVEEKTYPQLVGDAFSSVGEITAFLPPSGSQMIQRANQIDSQLREVQLLAERVERIAGNVIGLFDNSASESKTQQAKFIEYMEAIHFSGQPISLSTEYRDYENMALADLTISCDNETKAIKFTASFVQINYLQLIYVEISKKYASPSSSMAGKTSDVADKGGQNPETNTETSLLGSLFGG